MAQAKAPSSLDPLPFPFFLPSPLTPET
jgi:hypothetical protein